MNFGEWRRHALGTLSIELDPTVSHRLAGFTENAHHIKRRAPAQPKQQHFHRSDAGIAATVIRRTIHNDAVPTAGFRQKLNSVHPFNRALHIDLISLSALIGAPRVAYWPFVTQFHNRPGI